MSQLPPFIDLHNHLVPGVDDGAATVAESLDALRGLYRQGVRVLVATPHLLLPRLSTEGAVTRELDLQRRAFHRLADAVARETDLPMIGLGQEIWAPDAAAILRVVHRNDLGLDGSSTLLVEFGFDLTGSHDDVIEAVVGAGRRIVVAHPERYSYRPGCRPLDVMRRWRELGALLQVNAGSFEGHYDAHRPGASALSWTMVAEGLVDLVATDHHGPRRTGVSPLEAYRSLAAEGEEALAERAMVHRPAAVLRDEPVEPEPDPAVRSRWAAE
ncbi:MAG TPA: CpsB/CapC family capsule biosynthesis tyrosine phosphatase [Gemmatimonadales bacterium]|jgi:tyrosine-protein phosphatase YwqE|nr:CpsB/CapC family capsule biosynthesis tyrosine phosphatase [Gemmatimonadales bacterium]